jgi:hypothetical protein
MTEARTPCSASARVTFSDGTRGPSEDGTVSSVPNALDEPVASIAVPDVLTNGLPEPASAAPMALTARTSASTAPP